jgi:hypothetical protein
MTYSERITFLIGQFMEAYQYTLKNAFRFVCLEEAPKPASLETLEAKEAAALPLLCDSEEWSVSQKIAFFTGKGLSEKDFSALSLLIRKCAFLSVYFFVANAKALAREEIAIYESKITELSDYVHKAVELNQRLSKACDGFYSFGK